MRSEIALQAGFKVQKYGKIVGLHRSTIYRRFIKTKGISPKRFCTQEQLKRARELLLSSDTAISVLSSHSVRNLSGIDFKREGHYP